MSDQRNAEEVLADLTKSLGFLKGDLEEAKNNFEKDKVKYLQIIEKQAELVAKQDELIQNLNGQVGLYEQLVKIQEKQKLKNILKEYGMNNRTILGIIVAMALLFTLAALTGCGREDAHKVEKCTPVGYDKPKASCFLKHEFVNGAWLTTCCELVEE